ncbi:DUF7737 domain-containing protein [Micromonospora chersina]|uniref:DUF7737 domain-containing protein n=1 Tax=Micromonospora chersina TaxID=47854 RepID=UPI003F4CB920
MEPGNTYLCLVPSGRRPHEPIFLPFEDDRLALILSKAFLPRGGYGRCCRTSRSRPGRR